MACSCTSPINFSSIILEARVCVYISLTLDANRKRFVLCVLITGLNNLAANLRTNKMLFHLAGLPQEMCVRVSVCDIRN